MDVDHIKFLPGVSSVRAGMRDEKAIALQILSDNVPRAASQTQALALADRMEPNTAVLPDRLVPVDIDDFSWFFSQMKSNEVWVFDLA
jgi:hypothetical protein